MKHTYVYAMAGMLAIAGCAETKFAREEKSAEKQIAVAKDEGALSEDLAAARGSLKFAQESEATATADLNGGKEDLQRARDRQQVAHHVYNEKVAATARAEVKVTAAEKDVARAAERKEGLRSKGVAEKDVSAATGVEMSRAGQKLASMKAARDTLALEIPLADLERQAADTAYKAAETRISSAEQRLDVARSLYQRAEQQAKAAEMEALAGKREAIDTRLSKP